MFCLWCPLWSLLTVERLSCLRINQVSEVLDYWGDAGAIAWRLTDSDVRQTLSQRVDFSAHDILALKL
jgi:hypothetical protein